MATQTDSAMTDSRRANLISLAGIAIILLSAGAALLPAAADAKDSLVIGSLLLAAGVIETLAGTLRREVKALAIASGGVTALAGLIFMLKRTNQFFPTVTLVIAWLVIRSLILVAASRRAPGSVRIWTSLSAGMDFLLAVLLVAGLSVATIVVSIFGPTPPLIASFAWILAASFIVNGLLLLEVASCERRPNG
jgi:uncharacterized membrane protein HdeD (DUF308 family)